jgi:hypothetical protein
MIDKADSDSISESWRRVVLTIAGDPRTTPTSRNFQKWWSILGRKRQQKVRQWLSEFDLELFLEVFGNYVEAADDPDMERMYLERKLFLEGLLKQGLVKHSRLFLGVKPAKYLKTHYKPEELPDYALLKEPTKAVIFLELDNCYMMEGSHNFAMRLFTTLPDALKLTDYSKSFYYYNSVSTSIDHYFQGSTHSFLRIIHSGQWQQKAIQFMRKNNVPIKDIEIMMDPETYKDYKLRFGIPV